ncbi:MAG: hypothetical protein HY735_14045 [Verrucomicrobia bacterium]|nr:hypothetical protein [Verrucomicrobiota bacterium]
MKAPRVFAELFTLSLALTTATATDAAPTFQLLKSFGVSGVNPRGNLIMGADGALYGTTFNGGGGGRWGNFGGVFKMNLDGTGFRMLKSFDYNLDGGYPTEGLVQGADGALYGTTLGGGGFDEPGTLFKLDPNETSFTVLKTFDVFDTEPGSLVPGIDGALYGRTVRGGASGRGTVFKVNLDGTGFMVLRNFSDSEPHMPVALLQGMDGRLYGTTARGGTSNPGTVGTVFKLNLDGTGFTELKSFNESEASPIRIEMWFEHRNGDTPISLVQGTDGALYGTAPNGGAGNAGTVFKLNPDGTGFTVLKSFTSTDGAVPLGTLMQGSDGALYGTTRQGGDTGLGTVFKLNPDGSGFTILRNFNSSDGNYPAAGLLQGPDGSLYGTAPNGGTTSNDNPLGYGTLFKLRTDGTGFAVLRAFNLTAPDGRHLAGLTQGTDGALYGATTQGGANDFGTLFKLNPDGTGFTVLKDLDLTTGAYAGAKPIQGTDGALYGTTVEGGSGGGGTVFKLNIDGSSFTVLKNLDFTSSGGSPNAALMQGADGALYGTTAGTVFKLNIDGSSFTVLKNLDSTSGYQPLNAALMQGADGVLYGTALYGGPGDYGTLFKLNPDGSGFTVLKSFSRDANGFLPYGGVVQGTDGALYGTTSEGGATGFGTVFKIQSDGTSFGVLKSFASTDGAYPQDGLVQGSDQALYGTTWQGGSGDFGTVFTIQPDGTGFTVLKSFASIDGAFPFGALMQGTDGALYGTTFAGGGSDEGTVFRIILFQTPPGNNVVVQPVDASTGRTPVTLTFQNVTAGGETTVTSSTPGQQPGPPEGFRFGQPPIIYEIQTTAAFSGPVTLCFSYNDGDFQNEATLQLFHFENGAWVNVTRSLDTMNNVLCGQVTSLSPFAVVEEVNYPPIITSVSGPLTPLVVNSTATVSVNFTDRNAVDSHTVTFAWGDASPDTIVPASGGFAETTHPYTVPGVYRVLVTVIDAEGASVADHFEYVVIYDPTGGFVTGGGWINSPAGAYTLDPSLTGKANFGFVSKYQHGAAMPTGNTEFQFKAGDLNFHSTSYDWLVVAGAKAKYKGSGTINDSGDYAFMLTATDGQANGGGGTDLFRIKIWDQSSGVIIYDNQLNAPDDADATQAIVGGSIVVHKP